MTANYGQVEVDGAGVGLRPLRGNALRRSRADGQPQFGPYKIYRADEMPEMGVILVQTHEPSGPFGAKAIAEIPKDSVARPFQCRFDATGVRIRQIPFTPERVWQRLANSSLDTVAYNAYNVGNKRGG